LVLCEKTPNFALEIFANGKKRKVVKIFNRMSIAKTFGTAFALKRERNWTKIYVAVDIHGTVLRASYEGRETFDYFPSAKRALQMLSERQDVCLIIWSSVHDRNLTAYLKRFREDGIVFNYVNQNPEVENTALADFSQKFYFNVGIDNRFGFDAEKDWRKIILAMRSNREP